MFTLATTGISDAEATLLTYVGHAEGWLGPVTVERFSDAEYDLQVDCENGYSTWLPLSALRLIGRRTPIGSIAVLRELADCLALPAYRDYSRITAPGNAKCAYMRDDPAYWYAMLLFEAEGTAPMDQPDGEPNEAYDHYVETEFYMCPAHYAVAYERGEL